MDYARFNYVAQPEDNITNFYPRIGEYDNWSIEFGYKLIPSAKTAEEERATINEWIKAKADNPVYRFGFANRIDPSAQTEDLGDNAIYASELGMKNLQRIVPKLETFAYKNASNYDELEELYTQVVNQLNRYCGHVASNIAGVYEYNKSMDQEGAIYVAVPAQRQKDAVNFFLNNIFDTPEWLLNDNIASKLSQATLNSKVQSMQVRNLNRILAWNRLNRMTQYQEESGYTVEALFADLAQNLFNKTNPDAFERNLQASLINAFTDLSAEKSKANQDVQALASNQLSDLKSLVKKQGKKASDTTTKAHYNMLLKNLED